MNEQIDNDLKLSLSQALDTQFPLIPRITLCTTTPGIIRLSMWIRMEEVIKKALI